MSKYLSQEIFGNQTMSEMQCSICNNCRKVVADDTTLQSLSLSLLTCLSLRFLSGDIPYAVRSRGLRLLVTGGRHLPAVADASKL